MNITILILLSISLISVFTTTFYSSTDGQNNFYRQIAFIAVGVLIYFAATTLDAEWLSQLKIQILLLLLNLSSLLYLLVAGVEIANTRRWISLGFMQIQPAEFAKLIIILNAAYVLTSKLALPQIRIQSPYTKMGTWKAFVSENHHQISFTVRLIGSLTPTLISAFLIFLQPSLGNAFIVISIWLVILSGYINHPVNLIAYVFSALLGIGVTVQFVITDNPLSSWLWQLLILSCVAITIFTLVRSKYIHWAIPVVLILTSIVAGMSSNILWNSVLSDYQRDRITSFVQPETDPQGINYQVIKSKDAIASAGFFGYGLLRGPQLTNSPIPFSHTDFIFAAMVEQLGRSGAFIILLTYTVLLFRLSSLVTHLDSDFGKLVTIGIIGMLMLNVSINIGMNVGILPVTGVPLPLISYGGSAIITNMIGLGLVQMFYSQNRLNHSHAENLTLSFR